MEEDMRQLVNIGILFVNRNATGKDMQKTKEIKLHKK